MDGVIADLGSICDLADQYNAMVMVDDSHAVGFVGAHGRGSPEATGTEGRIDILTGTLGKALGGASGGYTSTSTEIASMASATIAALSVLEQPGPDDRGRIDRRARPDRVRR